MLLENSKPNIFSNYVKFDVIIFYTPADIRPVKKYPEQVKAFGLTLRSLREKKGLSQQMLADYCEVELRTIQRIEKGEHGVGLHILFAMAQILEVHPCSLFKDGDVS